MGDWQEIKMGLDRDKDAQKNSAVKLMGYPSLFCSWQKYPVLPGWLINVIKQIKDFNAVEMMLCNQIKVENTIITSS